MFRTKYWLWLNMVFGTGNQRIWQLMRFFDDPAYAYNVLKSGDMQNVLSDREKLNVNEISTDKCDELLNWCSSKGYGVISYSSPEYPPLLRHIYNPPSILYYDGNINSLSRGRILTIVGTRHAQSKSLETEHRLCRELALSGNIIASGFAVGVDITAHNAAISAGRPTIAVMGCGIDVNYPKENFGYREKIKNGGVFISEFPPGTSPIPSNFPRRNRILSGISLGVVVIEAGVKSGSLITADLALQQGREVFCLPPLDIYSEHFAGNVRLLRDGASPVYGAEDIRSFYMQFDLGRLDCDKHAPEYVINENDEQTVSSVPINENPIIKHSLADADDDNAKLADLTDDDRFSELTDELRSVAELLRSGQLHADFISEKLNMDAAELMVCLTELELCGIIESLPGKMYRIAPKL